MPKRTDIHTILVIGAGPIVIGQAAEFDYSGTQAVKALKREGYRVVLVNSNPATIMTDPELADATYVEPITPEIVELIIQQERPDALLPTVGGQTALNMAVTLAERGILARYGVQLIGASLGAMQLAEDRLLFKEAMLRAGLEVPRGGLATSLTEAVSVMEAIGSFPLLIRASFTLGGTGAATVHSREEFFEKAEFGLKQSPVGSILVEESVLGWKEYELEVMRDRADNFVVVCSIENLDPMGVHTGDSVTVAPALTLTDREYQRLRDQARTVMEVVGVETGGSNVQFAVDPATGRVIVIEMNPRVSRSSALASKATGFPIAKLAALLAVGYTLDELKNDITGTCAAFEPSIDYVVTKLPRWAFEKFPGVDPTLGPQMKSVGEAMAMGRTFKESFLKGLQSLELSRPSWPTPEHRTWEGDLASLATPRAERPWSLWEALRVGHTPAAIHAVSHVDPWFLAQLAEIVALEREVVAHAERERGGEGDKKGQLAMEQPQSPITLIRQAKRAGFSDEHLAWLLSAAGASAFGEPGGQSKIENRESKVDVRALRHQHRILPTFHMVDTCAAEFAATTPYLYSSYESESEAPPTERDKVIILGGGPNRIGQGIEFDYCCVHAVMAFRELGLETIMVNCNPETVSTDYDISDRLYFEPLTFEHVMNIVERETAEGRREKSEGGKDTDEGEDSSRSSLLKGVVVQFGGQTPLNLVRRLEAVGVPILGTGAEAIDLAEDRERFGALLAELDIPSPPYGIARNLAEAWRVAQEVGYPVMVRPSYVLGGRAMGIAYDAPQVAGFVEAAQAAAPRQPILIDHFLEDAFEVDVDAVADGERVVIGGIMQHIEEAGVHSGDSATVLPPYKISLYHLSHIRDYTQRLGLALGVRGLMNVQYAIKDDVVYVLEVNPRASRTVPYVSKATGVPLAKVAARVMAGQSLAEQGLLEEPTVDGFFVKEAVLPFRKFLGVDALLSPEMRSTGEVMGHASRFGHAFAKAQMATGDALPSEGTVFISVNDFDKGLALKLARDLHRLGFTLLATRGTAAALARVGLPVETVNKVSEGGRHIVERLRAGEVALIVNTPLGSTAHEDGVAIRTSAIRYGVPLMTTMSAAQAAVNGIRALRERALRVRSLQAHHGAGD